MPRALGPFLALPSALRTHGFAVAPDQSIGFLEAIRLLGPRGIDDIHRAALALFAIPPERRQEFDALFRAIFLGQTVAAPAEGEDEDVEAHEPQRSLAEVKADDAPSEAGTDSTTAERLAERALHPAAGQDPLAHFARHAPARLPRRRSYRFRAAAKGALDLRRSLRRAARHDGELVDLRRRRRKQRARRIVLLIDISGSMKDRTEEGLAFAHALSEAGERVETFTLGTRLTRISPGLRDRNRARALDRVSRLVADFDGGTRIGEALQTLLAVPRYRGLLRGAWVLVLSDGLERGSPQAMVEATRRVGRLAWRLDWLSPLVADPGYRPETAGIAQVLGDLDTLADGSDAAAICAHVLARRRAA